jgi:hypothetical protein
MTRIERMELLDVLRAEWGLDDSRIIARRGRFLERRARRGTRVGPDLFAARTLWQAQEREKEAGRRNRRIR